MKPYSSLALFLIGGLASSPAAADFQFRSRPDLAPPRLNITVQPHKSSDLSPGYIFVAPYPALGTDDTGPEQPGAYIFRQDGELVWSGQGYLGGWVADFAPVVWKGKPALRAFQGRLLLSQGRGIGNNVILNDKYEVVKTIRAGAHRLLSVHEFQIVDGGKEGRVLLEVPVVLPIGLQKWGGSKSQNWIINNGFQEVDIETGDVVFEWYSLDHIDPTDSPLTLRSGLGGSGNSSRNPWNYFHINSIDKDADGNYLISARNYASLFKINGTTGDLIWTLGGLAGQPSDFAREGDFQFAFQHDARFLARTLEASSGVIATETISLFDNGAHSAVDLGVHKSSRARIIRLDHIAKRATEVATFLAPDDLLAPSQGNAQRLPNGNVFVNWGQAGAITEFAHSSKVLFHAYLDSGVNGEGVQSYRGFKGNWTGFPREEAAIVALDEDGKTVVYVSWNGDTEVVRWRFYLGNETHAATRLVGEQARSGFETRFDVSREAVIWARSAVSAEALDRKGRVLTRTRPVAVQRGVFPELAGRLHKAGQQSEGRQEWMDEL